MTISRVPVGQILALKRRAVDVELEREYEEIGIRSFGRGIFHKEPTTGVSLGSKRVFWIEPNDLVISNVFAWEGAIAVASPAESGKIGSHRFMTFVPIDDQIDTSWAAWFFQSERGLELIRKASPGSAGRNRTLAIDRFELLEIPLPNVNEQRRVAACLSRVHLQAVELTLSSARSATLIQAFAASASARPDLDSSTKLQRGWRKVCLQSVIQLASDPVAVQPDSSYPNLGIYSFGRGLFAKPNIEGSTTSAKVLNRVHTGQFIYSRLFAFEGAYGAVPAEFDGHFVSNEFPTFDTDPAQLEARWLANYIRSPDRWAELASSSKGLGVRRQRVPVEAVLAYEVWLPPVEQQQAMLRISDSLAEAARRRAQSDKLIESLIASALNQAFAGLT